MNFLYLHIIINHGKVQIAYHISIHMCDEDNHQMEIKVMKKFQYDNFLFSLRVSLARFT